MIVRERREIEELARLLDGDAPDAVSPRVRRLAGTAETVGATITLEAPEPAFRAALRTLLLAQIDELGAPGPELTRRERAADAMAQRASRARRSTRLAVAGGVAGSLLATTGVTVAAASALPGETLYPVKRATESVRLALAGDLTATGRLQLMLAGERLDELALTLDHLSSELAVAILDDMDAASVAGTDALLASARTLDQPQLRGEVSAFTERQREGLAALMDQLPVTARANAQESLQLLRRIDALLLVDARETCDCEGGTAGASTEGGAADGACDCADDGTATTPAGSDTDSADGDSDTAGDSDSDAEADSGGATLDGEARQRLGPPPGSDVGAGDSQDSGPDDDPIGGSVERATDVATDPLDDATDAVSEGFDGASDATDAIGDTLDDATDAVSEGLGGVTDATSGGLLGGG